MNTPGLGLFIPHLPADDGVYLEDMRAGIDTLRCNIDLTLRFVPSFFYRNAQNGRYAICCYLVDFSRYADLTDPLNLSRLIHECDEGS